MRFNNLIAIEKAPSRGGHTYWKFRCDCGNEKEIMTCHVTGGIVKSCGCMLSAIQDVDNANPNDPDPRICKICENQFYGFIWDNRVFCYDCSPRGSSVADAHRSQKRAMKHLLVEYKGGKCVECGYDKCEGSLQFHHLNEKDKDFTLSNIKPNAITMSELYEEVDKCVLLCANCHAKKHEVVDKIGFIMGLPQIKQQCSLTKKCGICNSEFSTNRKHRQYCYFCVPYGLTKTEGDRARTRSVKRELLKYKGGAACLLCGFNEYEGALHLHHRDPDQKEFAFSMININGTTLTMEKLKEEADKCDVLCANCHAEIHYKMNDDLEC